MLLHEAEALLIKAFKQRVSRSHVDALQYFHIFCWHMLLCGDCIVHKTSGLPAQAALQHFFNGFVLTINRTRRIEVKNSHLRFARGLKLVWAGALSPCLDAVTRTSCWLLVAVVNLPKVVFQLL